MFGTMRDVLRVKGNKVHRARDTVVAGDAVMLLNRLGIGALVVTSDDRPVGMFTERDVLKRLVAARREPWSTPLRDVMSQPLVTIALQDTLELAMGVMTRQRLRHLPVVEDGRLVGLVSQGDLAVHIQRELQRELHDLASYMHGPHTSPSGLVPTGQ